MIYIFVATKAEAQAFVDKFRLKKQKIKSYSYFSNQNLCVIITGIGLQNAYKTAIFFQSYFHITKKDIIYNIGIAAADYSYEIGSVIKIGTCSYLTNHITFSQGETLYSVQKPLSSNHLGIYDMEGFSIAFVFQTYHLHIFKVISDHFQPEIITKEYAKKLLFQSMKNFF